MMFALGLLENIDLFAFLHRSLRSGLFFSPSFGVLRVLVVEG